MTYKPAFDKKLYERLAMKEGNQKIKSLREFETFANENGLTNGSYEGHITFQINNETLAFYKGNAKLSGNHLELGYGKTNSTEIPIKWFKNGIVQDQGQITGQATLNFGNNIQVILSLK